jgi:hypothetical protein
MPSAEKIISNLGGKFLQVNQFSSINNKWHAVVVIKKTKKTNWMYPRKWNLILNGGN